MPADEIIDKPGIVFVNATIAAEAREKSERQRILAAERRYRYEKNHPGRSHHGPNESKIDKYHIPTAERKFIAWDGEGPRDAGYALFGSSDGDYLRRPFLGTSECLDLILESEARNPTAIHIWFGGNYDASMILADLPWRCLSALHGFNRTVWRDYEIEHIPHKWLKVKRGKISATVYDIRSFFAGGYLDALEDFGIGTPEERDRIRVGKAGRAEFVWADIDEIEEYWRLELRLMPALAEKLRLAFSDAGYLPRSWHGPGALARTALRKHGIYNCMAESPPDVKVAAQIAFAGGRFEQFLGGNITDKVYIADINSAYPYYATFLPNLAKGEWRHGRGSTYGTFEPGKFAVYRIRYRGQPDSYRPYPLFRRMASGEVVWPHKVTGWYWAPEAELVANDPDAEFLEKWVFDEEDENDRPFAFLQEYYHRRKLLKKVGNPAEYTFKLIINSIYGQLAQRTGWDRKRKLAPNSHQLEWAGFITSGCRAEIYRIARTAGEKLVSIDTDGVSSLAPFSNLDIGDNLGQIKLEEYDGGVFWQSGIYALRKGNIWEKGKTRGIPKGTYTPDELLEALSRNEPLRLTKNVFVGYGLADGPGNRNKVNTWVREPHEFQFGGNGKRQHILRNCDRICTGGIHRLSAVQALYINDEESVPHWLPWLDNYLEKLTAAKWLLNDLELYDLNDLDTDDNWVRDLIG